MEPGKEDSPGNSQCCEGRYSRVPKIHHTRDQADNIMLFLTPEEREPCSTEKKINNRHKHSESQGDNVTRASKRIQNVTLKSPHVTPNADSLLSSLLKIINCECNLLNSNLPLIELKDMLSEFSQNETNTQ